MASALYMEGHAVTKPQVNTCPAKTVTSCGPFNHRISYFPKAYHYYTEVLGTNTTTGNYDRAYVDLFKVG